MNKHEADDSNSEMELNRAFAAYLKQIDSGEPLQFEEFIESYGALSQPLRQLILTEGKLHAWTARNEIDNDDATVRLQKLGWDESKEVDQFQEGLKQAATDEISPTVRLFGEYELLEELGRGGMGVVYLARQKRVNRLVALKMIIGGKFASQASIRRFYREAKAAAKLSHPHIVQAIDAGEWEDRHFLAMEFVEGQTLREILKAERLTIEPHQLAQYLATLARAIHYAHCRGILHRDLKPANIMVTRDGVVKITDFGLAKYFDQTDPTFESSSGSVLGTVNYMSPEQASGHTDKLGPQSDVYSLGTVLYEMLTGAPPFQSDTAATTIMQLLHGEVTPPSDLDETCDRDLEAICLRCLQKNPIDRYADAKELAEDCERYLRSEPVIARRLHLVHRVTSWLGGVPAIAFLRGRHPALATRSQRQFQRLVTGLLAIVVMALLLYRPSIEWSSLRQVDIGVGPQQGEYDRIGELIARSLPHGKQVRVVVTAGSRKSLQGLIDREFDMSIVQQNAIRFDEVDEIELVTALYREAVLILVKKDRGIRELDQLLGKKIALGPAGSGDRATGEQVLLHAGLSTDATVADQRWDELLTDPNLDGAIVTVGPKDKRLWKLLTSGQLQVIPLTETAKPNSVFQLHHFQNSDFPPGVTLFEGGVPSAWVPAVLAVRKSTPSWFVTQILESIYSTMNAVSSEIIPRKQVSEFMVGGTSFHPAAQDYFNVNGK